jgi:hypothetical protein
VKYISFYRSFCCAREREKVGKRKIWTRRKEIILCGMRGKRQRFGKRKKKKNVTLEDQNCQYTWL